MSLFAETIDPDKSERIWSISELTESIKSALQREFSSIWVVGEVSDLARPQSGHVYLSLKDESAVLRGVIWRNTAGRINFPLEDGTEVMCRGDIDVYAPRGSYQIVLRHIEPRGEGALQQALRRLQANLQSEGLFDPEHKQPLPKFPRRIAVVTSPTAAALRDFLEVARRRWRGGEILIVPTRVQGNGSAAEIVQAIETAARLRPQPDILVVTRGGGSIEDLWSFNEESVVRAIFNTQIPVVSAIGHEIDVTLSDLAADVRALTPSEAAELVFPSSDDVRSHLNHLRQRMSGALRQVAAQARTRLKAIAERRVLRLPLESIRDLARRVDELQIRATRAIWRGHRRFHEGTQQTAARLESLSPLAVLARGYSVTQRSADDQIVTAASELEVGDELTTRLARGLVISAVKTKRDA